MVITAAGTAYALQFSAADGANSFAAAVSAPPPVTNGDVTVPLSCYAVPCTVSTTLSSATAQTARAGHVTSAAPLGTGPCRSQHMAFRTSRSRSPPPVAARWPRAAGSSRYR
jgi:hypothetical protein